MDQDLRQIRREMRPIFLLLAAGLLFMAAGGCWLALALVWSVSNRRHIRRLQQTLQEREQKQ